MVKAYPGSTKKHDRDKNLPLHSCFHTWTGQKLLAYAGVLLDADVSAGLEKSKKYGYLLHHICKWSPPPLALVEKFCRDPRSCLLKDKEGNLPIHVIVERRDLRQPPIDVISALLRGNPECLAVKDKDGNLPVQSAIERGDAMPIHVVEEMIKAYPDACAVKDRDGNTPLHSACECRTKNVGTIVDILLKADKNGVAAKTKDKDGNLPLHSACEKEGVPSKDQTLMISTLIKAYPQGLQVKDKDGNLPLHSVLENRKADLPADLIAGQDEAAHYGARPWIRAPEAFGARSVCIVPHTDECRAACPV